MLTGCLHPVCYWYSIVHYKDSKDTEVTWFEVNVLCFVFIWKGLMVICVKKKEKEMNKDHFFPSFSE